MNQLRKILRLPQFRQRTHDWDIARTKLLTATDIASVLEYNEYQTKQEKFMQKINTHQTPEKKKNDAIDHGVKYEPVANELTSLKYATEIHEIGLKKHDTINFLGASPDGVML